MNRRAFLTALSATAVGVPRLTAHGARRALDRIGIQLYTVRHLLRRDFEGTLARIARLGYREVEFAGYFDRGPVLVKNVLTNLGLVAPAAHVDLRELRRAPDSLLEAAGVIGHRYLVVAWVAEEARRTLDAWKKVAEEFNRIGERCRRAGVQFAYHNHDFEFAPLEGKTPYDVLLAETDPGLVQLEIDLYWITKGGRDPLAYFARYPGRVPMVHVKDSAGAPEHRMVDVGRGTIDWRAIFARSGQAGIRHYFVEHDEPADPLAFARASYEYLKGLDF